MHQEEEDEELLAFMINLNMSLISCIYTYGFRTHKELFYRANKIDPNAKTERDRLVLHNLMVAIYKMSFS